MKYIVYNLLFLVGSSCSFNNTEIRELHFPYAKNYEAVYQTKSTLYNENGYPRTSTSDTLYFKINKDLSEAKAKIHEWLLLPGSIDKNIPDTLLSVIDSTGLYHYYSPGLLPEGAKEIYLISLPLKDKKIWKSHYLSFPAIATYLSIDSSVHTPAGIFKAFAIQYEFAPYYMDDFIKDKTRHEVRAVLKDYYSQEAGRIVSKMDYYVTDRKSGKKVYKILSNESILVRLLIPKK